MNAIKTILITSVFVLGALPIQAQNRPARGGSGGQPPTQAEWVSRLDKDGDGKVSESEFDGPAEHFTEFDQNGDGYIEESEVPSGPPQGENDQGSRRGGGR